MRASGHWRAFGIPPQHPQAIIQEVVEQTVAVATKEDVVRASLQDSGNIRELFEEYKVF